ncbi:MAG: IS110 family transposase [Anaerolineales bacterium]|nr:IS110 family transposase [Anaerolineales bacterium]MCB0019164.1 IS110 family transposase [Anaerolineales bacterium]MCB0028206.1 IS110 family transposase [Anaerolineales bacterium]
MSKRKRKKREAVNFDVLQQIQPHAAGIDVGAEEVYVCVPPGRDEEQIRQFATFTSDLHELAAWLVGCGVETVAMESTGVYWVPLFDILESHGLEVCLVNARHLKNVAGRKSDVADCEWLYQLHTYGLLRGSFHPPDEIRTLRVLARQREMLVRYRSAHIQHMQKALEQMNLKLNYVLSDITGVTGMAIIRDILAGEHNPERLAQHRNQRCKYSEEEIAKALTGNYRREQLFTLGQAVALYDHYGQQIAAVDVELAKLYATMDPPDDSLPSTRPPQPRRSKPRKNQANFDLATSLYQISGVDLTQIDGIDALTAQVILTEVGHDVRKWPTVKHFTSWLGLCPNNAITGGKVKRRGRKKTDSRVTAALRVAAQSLARSQAALGAFYRRIKTRHGAPKANVATAHKLARIIYYMLKQRVDYQDPGAEQYDEQQRQRAVRRLQKQAAKLGFTVQPALSAHA